MTPQLQQAIKLLQLSRLELQQSLNLQLLENPLLEELAVEAEEEQPIEERAQKEASESEESPREEGAESSQDSPDEFPVAESQDYFELDQRGTGGESLASTQEELPSYEQVLTKAPSLEEHLLWQLNLSSLLEPEKVVARLIIGNLDEDGYLRLPLEEIGSEAKVPVENVESILRHVQGFDPTGVAARDLRECLLIQLEYLNANPLGRIRGQAGSLRGSVVQAIVEHHLKDLEKKQYPKIAKALGISLEDVCLATKIIEGLEPKPARPFFRSDNHVILPDVYVVKDEGEWVVLLNDEGVPRLRISPYYRQLLGSSNDTSGNTKAYLEDKLRGAQWIIRSIEQRNKTILKAVRSIVKFQQGFFERGVTALKPLVLKQVAEDIGMHESTVSRVTANKYVHCAQGLKELKFFFSTGIQRTDNQEDMLSSVSVREMIKKMVVEEDPHNPLKDQEIAAKLRTYNIQLARRTVAKYRTEDNIPAASQRKKIF
jgi:RNA polymerase sigma-54 factor